VHLDEHHTDIRGAPCRVAAMIRAALDRSGLSRREAARVLCTSRSRLSTHATGRVAPSAAFVVALRRLADPW